MPSCAAIAPVHWMSRDTEFVASMRARRVMSHQLLGNLPRKRRFEAAPGIDRGQFASLTQVVRFEFRTLARERGDRAAPWFWHQSV